MQYRSRKYNTSIRSAFLAIRQLSCIIAHLKKYTNQLKSMQCRSRKDNTSIRSGRTIRRTSSLHKTQHIARRLHVKQPKFRPLSDRPTVETDVQKIGGAQLQYIFIHFKLVSGSKLETPRTSSLHKTQHIAIRLHVKQPKFRPLSDRPTFEMDVQKIGGAQLQYIFIHFKLVSSSKPQNPRTSSLHKTQHIAIRLHVKQPKFRPLSDRPTVETDVQKIGGAQLQYIFIHFKFVSGSKPQTPRTSSLHKTQHIAIRLHVKYPKFRPLSDRPTVETDVQKIGGAQLQYIFIHFKLVSGSKPQNPRTSSLHKTQHITIRLHVKQPKFRPLSDRPTVETDVQKIGGAQLQYIFIHFKLVSGSKPQTPRTSSLHKTLAHCHKATC